MLGRTRGPVSPGPRRKGLIPEEGGEAQGPGLGGNRTFLLHTQLRRATRLGSRLPQNESLHLQRDRARPQRHLPQREGQMTKHRAVSDQAGLTGRGQASEKGLRLPVVPHSPARPPPGPEAPPARLALSSSPPFQKELPP